MRTINKIVIHHSLTSRTQDVKKAISSFNRTHKERLHPETNGCGLHIAYHYIIGNNGEIEKTRPESEVGYHASNIKVNKESIGICFVGDFDKDFPSQKQIESVITLCQDICLRYKITEVEGHRKYAKKSCPGLNISDDFIHSLLKKPEPVDPIKSKALERKICNNLNWDKPLIKYETIVILDRLGLI